MNFAVALASNRLPRTNVNLKKFDGGSKKATLDRSVDIILNGELSDATRSTILKQLEQPLPDVELEEKDQVLNDDLTAGIERRPRRNRQARLLSPRGDPDVFKVVGLILGSPDFQRQ
jgi:hypothetical protein